MEQPKTAAMCQARVDGREPCQCQAISGKPFCQKHNPDRHPATLFNHRRWCSQMMPALDAQGRKTRPCQRYALYASRIGACQVHDPVARQAREDRPHRRELFLGLGGSVGGYALLLEALVAREIVTWAQLLRVAKEERIVEEILRETRQELEARWMETLKEAAAPRVVVPSSRQGKRR